MLKKTVKNKKLQLQLIGGLERTPIDSKSQETPHFHQVFLFGKFVSKAASRLGTAFRKCFGGQFESKPPVHCGSITQPQCNRN